MRPKWIDEFVSCLAAPNARDNQLERAFAIKDQNLPEQIFRYRRDDSNAVSNLKTDTVWLSSPDAYNDPFDSNFTIREEQFTSIFEEKVIDLFLDKSGLRNSVPANEIAAARAVLIRSARSQNLLETLKTLLMPRKR